MLTNRNKTFEKLFLTLTLCLILGFPNLHAQKFTTSGPPRISGGAQAALLKVTVSPASLKADEEVQSVSPGSPIFDAINFAGNAANNMGGLSIPPDPYGAAGPSHVVNVVNTSIEWYTKAGTLINSQSLQSFFSSATNTFDPKVLYDQYADRFVVVTLETQGNDDMDAGNDASKIYVAVSKTSDPTMGWWKGSINALTVISTKNCWADYPGFAIDEEAVYITNNMFEHESGNYAGVRLWIFPKTGIYAGGAIGESIYDPITGISAESLTCQPAHVFGTAPTGVGTYLVGYDALTDGTNEYIQTIRVDNPLSTPSFILDFTSMGDLEDFSMSVPEAPQMGGSELIDAGDRRALNAVYRDGKIAACFTHVGSGANAGQATAHWIIMDDNGGASPSLVDQGDVGGEDIATGTYTFYPSVALNMNGDLAIGFAASGPNIYAGAYYTGRAPSDAVGSTQDVETLKAGVAYYLRTFGNGSNRWGDYTATMVDPEDDVSFWVYNEYAMTQGTMTTMPDEVGRWATAFGKFTVNSGCPDDLPLAGVIDAGTYNAGMTITATGMINSPSVVNLIAGTAIQLDPTFSVNSGATMEASIGGCP
jgi:hypothetical protein